ncbi:hypothetical protein COY93_03580 [Candidatus Uhrbacteria bacterium CG_4_10_14_0_8_um_filter_58_22]|uniref:Uncharacterized protein n=1 Tax=Candidatus Uhrbacteria bacterium CG_4_10_14_0_8_um_filter_58_22 TaxID=1975029 RepID=A0A2M7Q9D3_9BACT|nr:MAG: hypothetical protein AUJ19_05080 [Parcubacteria group bacterium CG1_02_58_44]PIY62209.1 MAG: hypothetical protein COY93_03580 [Candidatus Uhrbacteria bacterium CG_4_10_14_0_8_um_filter_58_22]
MERLDLKSTAAAVGPLTKRWLFLGVLPFVVGTLFYVSSVVLILPKTWRSSVFILALLLCVALTASMILLSPVRLPSGVARWRAVLSPTVFVAGGFLFYSLLGSVPVRFVFVIVVMLTLLVFVMRLDSSDTLDPVHGVNRTVRLGRLMNLLGVFFATVFLFGIGWFVSLPVAVSAVVFGGLLSIVQYEALQQSGADRALTFRATVALTVLGVETYVGLSFLPTPFLVNATVLVIICFAVGRSAVRMLSGDIGTRGLKFGLAAAAVLVALVMATARWF